MAADSGLAIPTSLIQLHSGLVCEHPPTRLIRNRCGVIYIRWGLGAGQSFNNRFIKRVG